MAKNMRNGHSSSGDDEIFFDYEDEPITIDDLDPAAAGISPETGEFMWGNGD